MPREDLTERINEFITEGDDDRACDQLSDEACKEAPRSFVLNATSGGATKLAEALASPDLVLPWLLGSLGAPLALVGLLNPIRQTGSLAPQMIVSGAIRRLPVRKWVWVGAGLAQALCIGAMGAVAWSAASLGGASAGWMIVGLLALFSVASGVQSVTFKDVLAKTVPKGRRGRLLATRAFLGAGLTLGAGVAIRLLLSEDTEARAFAWPLWIAGALWVLGVALFALIGEKPGHTDGGRSAIREVRTGMQLLARERGFRRFLATRGLLLAIPLATPFYIVLFRERLGGGLGALGVFIVATGVTGLVASPIWGRFADKSSRRVMGVAGLIGAAGAGLALATTLLPEAWRTAPVLSAVLIVNAFAYAGARLGRKTYLVDAAPGDERPLYVASANTAIGALTIAGAGLGALGEVVGVEWLIVVLGALCLLAAVSAQRTPEAEDMVG